jgi:CheY-like chemotaxis protein
MTRILVVEDDEGLLRLLELMLRREGYEVLCAADGMEAIRLASQRKPELMVLDLMMPFAGGDAVLGFIRATRSLSQIRVVVISAHPNGLQIAEQLGADAFLAKPVSEHILADTIERVLHNGAG